jgi:hypothetical protein
VRQPPLPLLQVHARIEHTKAVATATALQGGPHYWPYTGKCTSILCTTRESIQNSLDARIPRSRSPVRVRFRFAAGSQALHPVPLLNRGATAGVETGIA